MLENRIDTLSASTFYMSGVDQAKANCIKPTDPGYNEFVKSWDNDPRTIAMRNFGVKLTKPDCITLEEIHYTEPNLVELYEKYKDIIDDASTFRSSINDTPKRVFKINITDINEDDTQTYLNQILNSYKHIPVIDPETGVIDTKDVYLPIDKDFIL